MTALIDADSWIYVIAWIDRPTEENPDGSTEQEIKSACDNMLREIMDLTQATDYIGAFSNRSFRHERYKYKSYKGNRPEPEEWFTRWKQVIIDHFTEAHGFLKCDGLEADDVVIAVAEIMRNCNHQHVIVSPDKDLRNYPGLFYVVKKVPGETTGSFVRITEELAYRSFWEQMVCGDDSDNVAGIPGLGPAKCKKLLDEALDPMQYPSLVQGAYQKYFGPHYGKIIYNETYETLLLMQEEHPLYDHYRTTLALVPGLRRTFARPMVSYFDVLSA